MPPPHHNGLRAEPAGRGHGHGRMHAKNPRLIRTGGNHAPLLAAMVRSARIPARLVVVGWDGDDSPRPVPRHIYAQALLPDGWTTAETVKPVALGWDAGEWKEGQGRRVAYSLVGDTGPLG